MGDSKARYTFRLRTGTTASRALDAEWDRCRWVWNQLVVESRTRHVWNEVARSNGVSDDGLLTFGYATADRMLTRWRATHAWLAQGSSVAQQQMVRAFDRSRTKALKDRANKVRGRRAGMPRLKKRDRAAPTLTYTTRGFTLVTDPAGRVRLRLAGGIVLPVVWSRPLPSPPTSVTVYRDALGHWWASFVVTVAAQPLPAAGDRTIGIDWGVTVTATTTDPAYDLSYGGHRKNAQTRLRRYQRMMARRAPAPGQKASNGYRNAKRQAAATHRQIADARRDRTRKWAKTIVRDFDQIAVENLMPGFMAGSTLAAKAADGAISQAKHDLIHMATKHGRDLRLVNPTWTTMDCSHCGARAKHRIPLSQRTYVCTSCGIVLPRDANSAAIMVVRAFGPEAASASTKPDRAGLNPACADGTRPDVPPGTQAA